MVSNQVRNREIIEREGIVAPILTGQFPFREAVGSLLYVANATRPEISYAVNVLIRHQLSPTKYEWDMVQRVLRYLLGSKSMTLTYRGKSDEL